MTNSSASRVFKHSIRKIISETAWDHSLQYAIRTVAGSVFLLVLQKRKVRHAVEMMIGIVFQLALLLGALLGALLGPLLEVLLERLLEALIAHVDSLSVVQQRRVRGVFLVAALVEADFDQLQVILSFLAMTLAEID